MRVLYLYAHPLPESFHAAILKEALAGLAEAKHEVDLADLYAEGFDPVMSVEERRDYHDTSKNQSRVESYVARLHAADALVVQFPVWSFGPPAILKGYFDRLLMPGVAFDISDPANVKQLLGNIRKIAGIATYGRPWWNAAYLLDPPRTMVTRYLKRVTGGSAPTEFYALYHMNVATEAQRTAFMTKVRKAMVRF
ncbi:MAG TPA: NAD(P)H-dependent oxidoreductase [Xanthobacteraceae bacterium]|nr:NAD(P)H-dependent oxidoreductase [Xanthobacteraceae bacterium]